MSIYNEDELNTPKWMNEEFFQKVLRQYENNNNIQLISIDVSPASLKGDHYASIMFRVKIEFRYDQVGPVVKRSLIAKSLPEEGLKAAMLAESELFETEISMYTETLPIFEQILAKHGDKTKFGPRAVYSELKPRKVIIFEDLCELGYDTVRGRYLSVDELREVLLKLSKLHAVSYMLGKTDNKSQLVTKYKEGLFCSDFVLQSDMISGGISKFIALLESNDELSVYAPKFKAIEKELFQNCIDLYKAHQNGVKDEIYVLNHGDFHMKNLMFKYNKKTKFEDVMMVDFQLSVFAPSIIDLVYGTFMLFDSEIRLHKRNEMLHFYFENFIETLKKIEYKGELPQFSQFQISGIRYRHFSIFLLSTFLPMIFAMIAVKPEDLKDVDTNTAMGDQNFVLNFYKNPVLVGELKKLLPSFLYAGLLG